MYKSKPILFFVVGFIWGKKFTSLEYVHRSPILSCLWFCQFSDHTLTWLDKSILGNVILCFLATVILGKVSWLILSKKVPVLVQGFKPPPAMLVKTLFKANNNRQMPKSHCCCCLAFSSSWMVKAGCAGTAAAAATPLRWGACTKMKWVKKNTKKHTKKTTKQYL